MCLRVIFEFIGHPYLLYKNGLGSVLNIRVYDAALPGSP
jgi:hypothetical protein